jgi:TANK-binding kinase 1
VFKLADFGTARELRADETFISLHGTEEYLYPGMYERALVNPSKRHQFSAQVDLWSVGATFFHAATGRLPFQPFRKRDDKKLMYHMISSKQPGVISGWQLEPSGDIIYSNTLPNDTIISDGLKDLITPVLAGLLESNISKMLSFERFFATIENISKMRVVDVFCVYLCTCHKVYISPEEPDGVGKLKELIQKQTDLDPRYQELFFENLPYKPAHPEPAAKLPFTTAERPMFVFGGNVKKTAELRSPILPSIPSIPQGFALSTDVVFAKECAKVMWSLKHHTEQIERMFRLMHQAALCYSHTVNHEYQLVVQQLQSLQQVNEAICRVLTSQVSGIMSLKELVQAANHVSDQKFQDDIQLLNGEITAKQKSLYEFSEAPRSMRDKMSQLKGEIGEKTSWDSKYCSELFHRSVETLHFLVRSVDSNYKTFLKEKKHKSMSTHDQKVHDFTKIKLHQKLLEAQEKVVGYLTGRETVYSKLGDWFTRLIPVRKDIEVVGGKMTKHAEECGQHLQAQNTWETNFQHRISELSRKMMTVLSQHSPPPRTSGSGSEGVDAPEDNASLEMQRRVLAKLRSFNSSVEQDLNEQRTKLERLNIAALYH